MSRRSAATGAHVSTAASSFLPPCSATEDGGRGPDLTNFIPLVRDGKCDKGGEDGTENESGKSGRKG